MRLIVVRPGFGYVGNEIPDRTILGNEFPMVSKSATAAKPYLIFTLPRVWFSVRKS